MKLEDATKIADEIVRICVPACQREQGDPSAACVVGGGIRRGKPDIHDIEIVAMPILKAPTPTFGSRVIHKTYLDAAIWQMVEGGMLKGKIKDGPRMKQYDVNLEYFGLSQTPEPFRVEFYLCIPPSQWGVLYTIRTGPNSMDNAFSKWMVTERRNGGALPNGYICKDNCIGKRVLAEYKEDERDGIIPMPKEEDFFEFCGLPWIEPSKRLAKWGSMR